MPVNEPVAGVPMTADDAIQRLARYAAGLTLDSVPEPARARARDVLSDTIGAIIAGNQEPEMTILAAELADSGPARVLGSARCAAAPTAALINGTAGVWHELDEGNRFARGHPGIHLVPVVLAAGEEVGASGVQVLEALIAGYEIASRAGRAVRLREGIHPHGTFPALGAAAAAAKLRGGSAEEIARAIALSSSLIIAAMYGAAFEGATVRNTYSGMGAHNGILAAAMARAGFSAQRNSAGVMFGTLLGQEWDEAALTDGLGERYELENGYFKLFSACRYAHGTLDLVDQLRSMHGLRAGDVDQVTVYSHPSAVALGEHTVDSPLAARFSTPALVALMLNGYGKMWDIPADVLHQPEVRDLAGRVNLVLDPDAALAYPRESRTKVEITLRGGTKFSAEATAVNGDPEQPFSADDLESKFLALAGRALGVTGALAAYQAWHAPEQIADIREATALLTPAG